MRKRGVANIISSSRVTATGPENTCRRFTASRLCVINPTLTRGAICFHRFAVIIASFSMLYFGFLQLFRHWLFYTHLPLIKNFKFLFFMFHPILLENFIDPIDNETFNEEMSHDQNQANQNNRRKAIASNSK